MNGRELATLVLRNIGEDEDTVTYGEYADRIYAALNEAYQQACAFRYRPRKKVEILPQEESVISLDSLPEDYYAPHSITDGQGYGVMFAWEPDGLRLGRKCDVVTLDYIYRPPVLDEDVTPVLPPVFHTALADYAAFRIMIPGKAAPGPGGLVLCHYQRVMVQLTPMGTLAPLSIDTDRRRILWRTHISWTIPGFPGWISPYPSWIPRSMPPMTPRISRLREAFL